MGLPDGVTVTNSTGVKTTMVSEHAMPAARAAAADAGQPRGPERAPLAARGHQPQDGHARGRHGLHHRAGQHRPRTRAQAQGLRRASDRGLARGQGRRRHRGGVSARAHQGGAGAGGRGGDHHQRRRDQPAHDRRRRAGGDEALGLHRQRRPRQHHRGGGADRRIEGRAPRRRRPRRRRGRAAADNPLWDMPNVIMSPHIAGGGSTGYPQHKKLFAENLERFRTGQPLLNECPDPAKA